MKLWGGRFDKIVDETLENFGASIHFDHALWQDDIVGSCAHVTALHDANLLSAEEAQQIISGLQHIASKIANGQINFSVKDEDIHMNIERLLHLEIGELAGKIHTGRSRNDQVALDTRLYLRRELLLLLDDIVTLQKSLLAQANDHMDTIFPGYTHLQRAQPIRFGHHLLAYSWMFLRDSQRLQQNFRSANKLPLGAGALAGNSFAINQHKIAQNLGFSEVYHNSLDAVSDRDYLVEFLATASMIMMHLSKLCEELIIWSSQEFSFIELDDAFCTGSSMMPQKKNPDSAELIRGKTGRVYGALMSLLTTLKGLPLAYNKDLQEDKEGVFDAVKTLHNCLHMMAKMIATMKVNQETISQSLSEGFLIATELANYLVKKEVPFRKAHEIVGKIVKFAIQSEEPLSKTFLQNASPLFEDDIEQFLSMHFVVEQCNNHCGTAKVSLLQQYHELAESITLFEKWLISKKRLSSLKVSNCAPLFK